MKYLIVGLGNIGDEYADTRHNVGFLAADALASALKCTFTTDRYAAVARGTLKGRTLVIIKPSTYMNLSGKAVRYWMQREEIPVENLLVIVDDLALPPGALRLKIKGGDGGHNGLISIAELIQTNQYARLRFGIGNDFPKGMQVEYVLARWSEEEMKALTPRVADCVELIKSFVLTGAERTMNYFNKRGEGKGPATA